jgi:hypothetical protein
MSSHESFFVIGERADGSKSIQTSHVTRESADNALSMIPGKSGYVEFFIEAFAEWPALDTNAARDDAGQDSTRARPPQCDGSRADRPDDEQNRAS